MGKRAEILNADFMDLKADDLGQFDLILNIGTLFVVPPDAAQGDVQRLMYVHVPAAWVTFLAFGVVFIASAAYLKTGRIQWDRVAVSDVASIRNKAWRIEP